MYRNVIRKNKQFLYFRIVIAIAVQSQNPVRLFRHSLLRAMHSPQHILYVFIERQIFRNIIYLCSYLKQNAPYPGIIRFQQIPMIIGQQPVSVPHQKYTDYRNRQNQRQKINRIQLRLYAGLSK